VGTTGEGREDKAQVGGVNVSTGVMVVMREGVRICSADVSGDRAYQVHSFKRVCTALFSTTGTMEPSARSTWARTTHANRPLPSNAVPRAGMGSPWHLRGSRCMSGFEAIRARISCQWHRASSRCNVPARNAVRAFFSSAARSSSNLLSFRDSRCE